LLSRKSLKSEFYFYLYNKIMFLIIGLGNPTAKYNNTRHNLGFMVIDNLASTLKTSKTEIDSKKRVVWFKKRIKEILIGAKPLTYMNESGIAVKTLLDEFKIDPDNLVVVHDDLDLEVGRLKIKKGSSSGGHLGIESIIEKIGTRNFIRFRIGIGRPPKRKKPSEFVLEPFKKNEIEDIEFAIQKATDAIINLVKFGLEKTIGKYN